MRLQVGRIARRQQLVHGISVHNLMQALDLANLKIARIALILDDILLRVVRQRDHAMVRVLDMQITTERNHRDHVKITQVINQAMQFVGRHSLIEQHLVGLSVDHMRAVKGHQQTVMVLKVELLRQGVQPPCGTPEAKMSLMPDSCAASSFSRVRELITFWSLVSVPSISIAMALIAICASLHRFYRALSYPSRGTFAQRAYDGCKTTPFETKAKKYLQRRVPTYKLIKDRCCGFK